MADTLSVAALGGVVRIDLGSLDSASAGAVAAAWADARCADAPAGPLVVPDSTNDTTVMLADLTQRVTVAAIDAQQGRHLMFHAAGLALEDGRVVVLIGPSGRGKTTAARLLGARFGYVSDEAVAVTDAGEVLAYRKPLSIIEGGGAKTQRSPSSLGLRLDAEHPLRLAALVLLDRREDAPHDPVVERVDLGDALGELVPQLSYLTALPAPLHRLARHAAAVGGITRVRYRDAADLAAVLPALAHPDPRWIDPPPVPDASRPQPPRAYEDDAPSYTRVDVVDTLELRDPERLAVLSPVRGQEAKVHVLAGVAPAIWRAAVGASVEALCEAAVAEYGVPAGASASGVVQRAVSELVGAGLLRRSEAPRWSVCPDVAWADREGRVVLLDVREPAAQPAALGGSASVIWRELAAGAVATSELVARVARAVGVEEELVDADVRTFVAGLVEARLVVPRASTEIDSSDLTDP